MSLVNAVIIAELQDQYLRDLIFVKKKWFSYILKSMLIL